MRDSDADIAINTLNKLITQELKAARAGSCQGNRPLEECATTRSDAYAFARDKIKEALADAVEERDAGNPFLPRRDELVTQDMHTCDLCGRWCSGPVYRVCLCYADQSRVASEVCAAGSSRRHGRLDTPPDGPISNATSLRTPPTIHSRRTPMSDSINPDHYRNGPFECIELTRLLSFEWGNVVKYCFRWKGKNGVEDLDKAVWYAKDAIMHGVPLTDEGHRDEVVALLSTLAEADWADLRDVWAVMAGGCRQHALTILIRKIAEIENGRTKEES